MSGIERIDGAIGRLPLHGVVATRALETAALAGVPGYALMARAGLRSIRTSTSTLNPWPGRPTERVCWPEAKRPATRALCSI